MALFRRSTPVEERSAWADAWMAGIEPTARSKAGVNVTPDSSMQLAAVYASVRLLSETVATLPVGVYTKVGPAREPLGTTPQFLKFGGHSSKIEMLGQVMVSLLLHGNAYLAVLREKSGEPIRLEPLDPTKVTPVWRGNSVVYRVNGTEYDHWTITHIKGMTRPGSLVGVSPIEAATETIGLGLATQQFGGKLFASGMPAAVVTTPNEMSPVAAAQLKEQWRQLYGGTDNAGKVAVLTKGAALQAVSVTPRDGQMIEVRRFQINDIARIFGVPTSLLQHSDGPEMGQSLHDKNVQFAQYSLLPWVARIEEGLNQVLRSSSAPPEAFVRLNMDGLTRGDINSRFSVYTAAVTAGIFTVNEIRALEDMAPVPWGDTPISVQVQPPEESDFADE